MNGLLLVDKTVGPTSFDLIRQLRRITGFKKIGHAGTLDPLASGLMLLLFGTACKQAEQFSKLDKTYIAEITLGANSTTGDMEGEKTAISSAEPTGAAIESALQTFLGEITQTPSPYSAIKINGTEAYKLARAGQDVAMPSRQVTIHSIELLSYDYPRLTIETSVSSGTYIRTLAEDIGAVLGTGAYLSALRRTLVGEFDVAEGVKLDGVPAERVQQHLIDLDK